MAILKMERKRTMLFAWLQETTQKKDSDQPFNQTSGGYFTKFQMAVDNFPFFNISPSAEVKEMAAIQDCFAIIIQLQTV